MKAIGLLSGGLDSTLAVKLMLEEGIEVEAVNFLTVFCTCTARGRTCLSSKAASDQLGIKLKVFEISREYLEIVKAPKYGYGRNLNPCIDCRIFIFRKAGEYMKDTGARFIVTGEVLGERPMSQRMEAMKLIERESGLEGLIVRPLSAKFFPITIPEKMGWIRREKMLAIRGRSRRPQIQLAEKLNIRDYPCAAGGCLLTDEGFSRRLRDIMRHGRVTLRDVKFLKYGRHFRLNKKAKLVVGRNESENTLLGMLAEESDVVFTPDDVKGPIGVGRGEFSHNDILLSSRIIARYSDREGRESIRISCRRGKDISFVLSPSIDEESLKSLRI